MDFMPVASMKRLNLPSRHMDEIPVMVKNGFSNVRAMLRQLSPIADRRTAFH